jgi:hypothetical protein
MRSRLFLSLVLLFLLTSCGFGEDFDKSLTSFKKVCAKWTGLDISTLKPSTVERLVIESTPLINEGIAMKDGVSPIGNRMQASLSAIQQVFVDQEILLDETLRYKSKGDQLADLLQKRTFEVRQETIEIQFKTAESNFASHCEYVEQQLRRAGRR